MEEGWEVGAGGDGDVRGYERSGVEEVGVRQEKSRSIRRRIRGCVTHGSEQGRKKEKRLNALLNGDSPCRR